MQNRGPWPLAHMGHCGIALVTGFWGISMYQWIVMLALCVCAGLAHARPIHATSGGSLLREPGPAKDCGTEVEGGDAALVVAGRMHVRFRGTAQGLARMHGWLSQPVQLRDDVPAPGAAPALPAPATRRDVLARALGAIDIGTRTLYSGTVPRMHWVLVDEPVICQDGRRHTAADGSVWFDWPISTDLHHASAPYDPRQVLFLLARVIAHESAHLLQYERDPRLWHTARRMRAPDEDFDRFPNLESGAVLFDQAVLQSVWPASVNEAMPALVWQADPALLALLVPNPVERQAFTNVLAWAVAQTGAPVADERQDAMLRRWLAQAAVALDSPNRPSALCKPATLRAPSGR